MRCGAGGHGNCRWRHRCLCSSCDGDVSAIPEFLPIPAISTAHARTTRGCGAPRAPVGCRPTCRLHTLEISQVALIVDATVARRPIPLQSAMGACQACRDRITHLVHFEVKMRASWWWEVPTLWMLGVHRLAIWIGVIGHAGCTRSCSFEEPCV